ncbi:MAG: GxxExxY protein [Candidatus Omnitrophica bacterium]|nr:GxxExxY protein [Candidatus Omnitrophota bacterium]
MSRNHEKELISTLGKPKWDRKPELYELSNQVIGLGIRVHRTLGSGFHESVYSKALTHELVKQQIPFVQELPITVVYDGVVVGRHRLDLVIRDSLLLELKAAVSINRFHLAQMLSYLRATQKPLGLILNFSRATLEIKRVVN